MRGLNDKETRPPIPDYRDILKHEFQNIRNRKPSFSLRAFAKQIGVSPSSLSEVFAGKYNLSIKSASAAADKMGFNLEKKDFFLNAVRLNTEKNPERREKITNKLRNYLAQQQEYFEYKEEEFRSISQWQHLAIMVASELKQFDGQLDLIASALNIPIQKAVESANRLKMLGMVDFSKGRIKVLQHRTRTQTKVPSVAFRNFHKQMLKQAMDSISFDPLSVRFVNTSMVTISSDRLEEAKTFLSDCRQQFIERFAQDESPDSVYAASFVLFPLVHEKKQSGLDLLN